MTDRRMANLTCVGQHHEPGVPRSSVLFLGGIGFTSPWHVPARSGTPV